MPKAYLPIEFVRGLELRDIKCAALSDELYVASPGGRIVERDEHHVGKVHAGELDLQHPGCGLDLGLQTMRRPTKHHHRTCKLAYELLALYDLRNMAGDLQGSSV